MRLLPVDLFEGLAVGYSGKIGVVDGFGNVGDQLLQAALRQILTELGFEFRTLNPWVDDFSSVITVILFGGGNINGFPPCQAVRRQVRQTVAGKGFYVVQAPQSILPAGLLHDAEDLGWIDRIFVREKTSKDFCEESVLMPDLALGFDFPDVTSEPLRDGTWYFLRRKGLSLFSEHVQNMAVDPAEDCLTWREYFRRASMFEHIVTDRLHFAICGLAAGRKVTLLPGGYHKNVSMIDTWLGDLGCGWMMRDDVKKSDLAIQVARVRDIEHRIGGDLWTQA